MSRDAIRFCIKRKELYESPGLNERLYLHNKGFTEIRNLEPFTEVSSLFLEGNELTKIDGLSAQKQLQSLYLQKNKIGACVPRALRWIAECRN
jgi:dynein assembly factor 1